jgi:hypothetical protein
MTMKLARDTKLRDVLTTLTDPDRYVSQAFGVMHRATKEHGEVVMRLGITGTGKLPNYRLEERLNRPAAYCD